MNDERQIHMTKWDTATGRILGTVSMAPLMVQDQEQDGLYPGVLDSETVYFDVSTGKPKVRPKMTLTISKTTIQSDGQDEVEILGLPAATVVHTSSGPVEVHDGEFIFTTFFSGTHVFWLEAFPFCSERLVIHAV